MWMALVGVWCFGLDFGFAEFWLFRVAGFGFREV